MLGGVALLALVAAEPGQAGLDPLAVISTWGPAGVLVVLLITGVLVTKRELDKADRVSEQWRVAFQTEQTAHIKTREALAVAEDRASVAQPLAETGRRLLEQLGHQAAAPAPQGQDWRPR